MEARARPASDEGILETSSSEAVALAVVHLTHRFGSVIAIDDVNLSVEPGQFVALLGPSGCGKTTLLRIIAGLLRQNQGHVAIGNEIVDDLPPNERAAGIVFQNYALFPHMTVESNVAYGLKARGVSSKQSTHVVARMLQLVRMEAYARRYPRELSGGQQQRIALARTLAVSPKVLLLDEPFGALDKNLRLDMQIEIKRLLRELGITTIMVTHDQEEALSMADQIAVMNHGRVEQFASPDDVYDRPKSLFVATFVGTANVLNGELVARNTSLSIIIGGDEMPLPSVPSHLSHGKGTLVIRPEHLRFVGPTESGITARVEMALPLGPSIIYQLTLKDGAQVKVTRTRSDGQTRHASGQTVRIGLTPGAPASVFEN
jgi:putative spermidine/putrescine transport system ATP-binding protein